MFFGFADENYLENSVVKTTSNEKFDHHYVKNIWKQEPSSVLFITDVYKCLMLNTLK